MLREIRVYLGFRLDIFEDCFLIVERERNNVQKSQIILRGISEVDKTALVGLGSVAILPCSYLLGFLYRPKRERNLFRQRHRCHFCCTGPRLTVVVRCGPSESSAKQLFSTISRLCLSYRICAATAVVLSCAFRSRIWNRTFR